MRLYEVNPNNVIKNIAGIKPGFNWQKTQEKKNAIFKINRVEVP